MKNPSSIILVSFVLVSVSSFILYENNGQDYDKVLSKEYAYYAGLAYCPKKCL